MNGLKQIGEFGLIELIRKKSPVFKSTFVGIGDDAACLAGTGKRFALLSTDVMVEGIDFTFRLATPEQVGRKALAINLSDIAAMGGEPHAALVGLVLPKSATLKSLMRFHQGMSKLARAYRVSLVGGDLSRGPCWVVAVSIYGTVSQGKAVLRSGARPGDLICVTGSFGGSIAKKHLDFAPRIREGQFLAKTGATAMIDVSDGLLQDLEHVLGASKVSADLWLDKIPVSRDAVRLSRGEKQKALKRALTDGEDFELLFTLASSKWETVRRQWKKRFCTPLTVIGKVKSSKVRRPVYFQDGKPVELAFKKRGYQHFT